MLIELSDKEWFSMLLVLVSVFVLLSKSYLAEWPSFGRELLIRLTLCAFCGMSACHFGFFPFWYRNWDFGSDCASPWS